MFDATRETLHQGRVTRYRLTRNAEPLSSDDVLDAWAHSDTFRIFFLDLLAQSPFEAFRWETPAWRSDLLERPFEFVLIDSPGLARAVDPVPFARHFDTQDAGEGIVVFDNLGRDATLVVPSPRGPDLAYGHLAAFTRRAPASQNHALWGTVGAAMQQRIGEQPLWLSTAGAGVSWLHVRLDARPKYYNFQPYRVAG